MTEWWEQRIIFLLIFPPENSNSIFFSSLKVYNIPKICAVFSTFSLQLTNDFLASFSRQKNLMRFYFYIFYIKSPLKKFKWEEKKHILWNSKISSWETTNQIAMWILKFRVDSPWRVILENPVALWKFKAALKMGWDRQPFKGNLFTLFWMIWAKLQGYFHDINYQSTGFENTFLSNVITWTYLEKILSELRIFTEKCKLLCVENVPIWKIIKNYGRVLIYYLLYNLLLLVVEKLRHRDLRKKRLS